MKSTEHQSEFTCARFEGPIFELMAPVEWDVFANPAYQVIFLGPQIGAMQANIAIRLVLTKPEYTRDMILDNTRKTQADNLEDYVVLSEYLHPVNENAPAVISRYYQWYNPVADAVVFQSQVIVCAGTYTHFVTATQPNNDRRKSLNALFEEVLGSYRAYRFSFDRHV